MILFKTLLMVGWQWWWGSWWASLGGPWGHVAFWRINPLPWQRRYYVYEPMVAKEFQKDKAGNKGFSLWWLSKTMDDVAF